MGRRFEDFTSNGIGCVVDVMETESENIKEVWGKMEEEYQDYSDAIIQLEKKWTGDSKDVFAIFACCANKAVSTAKSTVHTYKTNQSTFLKNFKEQNMQIEENAGTN